MNRRLTIICLTALLAAVSLHAEDFADASQTRSRSVFTLEECVRMCRENDPYVKNARLDVLSAQEQKTEAVWSYFPSLSLSGIGFYAFNPLLKVTLSDILGKSDAARDLTEQITAAANEYGVNSTFTTFKQGYGVSLMALQPLYTGGRIISGNRLASLGIEAARLQSRVRERQSVQDVEKKYWTVVALQEKWRTLDHTDSLLCSIERDVVSAVSAGLATESDLMQVALKKKELSSGRIRLRSGLALAKMDIFNAIGYEYSYSSLDDIVFEGGMLSSDELLSPNSYVVPEDKVGEFDETRLLQMQVESKRLEKKMQVGEYLPSLALGASCGYGDFQSRSHGTLNSAVFATVKIPLTDVGKAVSRAKRYEYQIEKASNERQYLDSQLLLQLRQLQLSMESAWQQMEVSREASAVAQDSFDRVKADYDAGLATVSELLQSELELRGCEEELIDRRIDYFNAVSDYRSRVGAADTENK